MVAPMLTARGYLATATDPNNGKIYALGGDDGRHVFDTAEVYGP